MQQVGQVLRAADVRAIYLVHGSFVGADASGLFREIARVSSTAAEPLRRLQKQLLDALAKDTGNYTVEFANEFESAVEIPGEPHLPVRLFNWSSENHHIGRADGGVRLIEALFDDEAAKLGRSHLVAQPRRKRTRADDEFVGRGQRNSGAVFPRLSFLLSVARFQSG